MQDENLKELYPLSKKWLLLKISPWLLAAFSIILTALLFRSDFPQLWLKYLFRGGFVLILIIVAVRLAYLFGYYLTFDYKLRGDELLISRGIIFKEPFGFSLPKINAIHVNRSLGEILWGLSTIEIVVAGVLDRRLTNISGLSKKTAEALKDHLFKLS